MLALVARETVAKGARDNPGVRITMGTVRAVQAETTDSVVYVTCHADGDPDSVEVNAVSTAGTVALGDRVVLTWTPPHGLLVTGRITREPDPEPEPGDAVYGSVSLAAGGTQSGIVGESLTRFEGDTVGAASGTTPTAGPASIEIETDGVYEATFNVQWTTLDTVNNDPVGLAGGEMELAKTEIEVGDDSFSSARFGVPSPSESDDWSFVSTGSPTDNRWVAAFSGDAEIIVRTIWEFPLTAGDTMVAGAELWNGRPYVDGVRLDTAPHGFVGATFPDIGDVTIVDDKLVWAGRIQLGDSIYVSGVLYAYGGATPVTITDATYGHSEISLQRLNPPEYSIGIAVHDAADVFSRWVGAAEGNGNGGNGSSGSYLALSAEAPQFAAVAGEKIVAYLWHNAAGLRSVFSLNVFDQPHTTCGLDVQLVAAS